MPGMMKLVATLLLTILVVKEGILDIQAGKKRPPSASERFQGYQGVKRGEFQGPPEERAPFVIPTIDATEGANPQLVPPDPDGAVLVRGWTKDQNIRFIKLIRDHITDKGHIPMEAIGRHFPGKTNKSLWYNLNQLEAAGRLTDLPIKRVRRMGRPRTMPGNPRTEVATFFANLQACAGAGEPIFHEVPFPTFSGLRASHPAGRPTVSTEDWVRRVSEYPDFFGNDHPGSHERVSEEPPPPWDRPLELEGEQPTSPKEMDQ
ncbi:MAG: SANT/Myb domain-containing protein [Holosporales bacterium]|jgi:hypothetical protein|nr:SANT/Myb domain-containing protein [Holosporales bacterium]